MASGRIQKREGPSAVSALGLFHFFQSILLLSDSSKCREFHVIGLYLLGRHRFSYRTQYIFLSVSRLNPMNWSPTFNHLRVTFTSSVSYNLLNLWILESLSFCWMSITKSPMLHWVSPPTLCTRFAEPESPYLRILLNPHANLVGNLT